MAGEGEEVVAEAVDVGDGQGMDGGCRGEGYNVAFGAAADGTGDVGLAGGGAASGKDEAVEWG